MGAQAKQPPCHQNLSVPSSVSTMLPKKAATSMKGGAKPMTKTAIAKAVAEQYELKTKTATKILSVLGEVAAKELKSHGKFKFPGLFQIKTRHKPATKACQKMFFGELKTVKAKPAKTVVKAFPLAALKKSV